jgi:hypothetical protein
MKGKTMKMSKLRGHVCLTGFVLSVVLAITGCAGQKVLIKPASAEKMIHYSELKGWDETKSLNGYVIYVNEGETIPLKISMESDFMDFKQDRIDVIAKQKLYFMIKMPEDLTAEELARLEDLKADHFSKMSRDEMSAFFKDYMLYVSRDAKHWAPLYGSRAYRKVLGFKEGLIHFGIMAGPANGLEANLGIETVK